MALRAIRSRSMRSPSSSSYKKLSEQSNEQRQYHMQQQLLSLNLEAPASNNGLIYNDLATRRSSNFIKRLFFMRSRKNKEKPSVTNSQSLKSSARAAVDNFLAGPPSQITEEDIRRKEYVDILRRLSASVRVR